jgi:hypothetical protein
MVQTESLPTPQQHRCLNTSVTNVAMMGQIEKEARKLSGISLHETDEIDNAGVNLTEELDVCLSLSLCVSHPFSLCLPVLFCSVLFCRRQY